MIMAVVDISCFVSSWIMSHFGKKPVSGGRPARDSSVSIRDVFSDGIFVQEVIIVDSFDELVVLRAEKMEAVTMEYR